MWAAEVSLFVLLFAGNASPHSADPCEVSLLWEERAHNSALPYSDAIPARLGQARSSATMTPVYTTCTEDQTHGHLGGFIKEYRMDYTQYLCYTNSRNYARECNGDRTYESIS